MITITLPWFLYACCFACMIAGGMILGNRLFSVMDGVGIGLMASSFLMAALIILYGYLR